MRNVALFALLVALAASCSAFRPALVTAQAAFEVYSLELVAAGNGAVYSNSRFVAVEYGASARFVLRGPREYGGEIEELKRYEVDAGAGRRVWELVFDQEGKPRVVASSWEAARVSMPHMPPVAEEAPDAP